MNLQAISGFRTAAVMATLFLAITTVRPAKVSAQQYSVPKAAHEAQEDQERTAKAARDAEEDQQRAMNKAAHEAQEDVDRAAKAASDAEQDQQRAMNKAAHEAQEDGTAPRRRHATLNKISNAR